MKFNVDTIPKLSDEDLQRLVAELMKTIKAARRKVFKLLKKDNELMSTWLGNLSSVGTQKDLPEETKRIAEEKRERFELTLVSSPEAFITYQTMAFTIRMLDEVRAERMRRMDAKKAKKKRVTHTNDPETDTSAGGEAHSASNGSQVRTRQPSTACTPGSQPYGFSTCDAYDA